MEEKLKELLENSYAPYSNFPVSSIVVTNDGKTFGGVNVENANGTSICAERNAISLVVSQGYKKEDIKEIHVMGKTDKIITPCFACRQVLLEFMEKERCVYCHSYDGKVKKYTINELCPYPFSSEDLI